MNTDQEKCMTCQNNDCPFYGCPYPDFVRWIECDPGQPVYLESMTVTGLYVVQKGRIEEYYFNYKEKETLMHFAGEGEIFGHKDFGGSKHLYSTRAVHHSVICKIRKSDLFELCCLHPEISRQLISFFLKELKKTDEKIINKQYA